jgi:hypothetical protein
VGDTGDDGFRPTLISSRHHPTGGDDGGRLSSARRAVTTGGDNGLGPRDKGIFLRLCAAVKAEAETQKKRPRGHNRGLER